jgi:hypothetical protein
MTITGSGLARSAHHVDYALAGGAVEQLFGEFADFRFKLADAPRCESAAHQPPQPRMDGRIGKHHARRGAEDADAFLQKRRARRHAREMFMVTQHGGAISIARH